MKEIKIRGWDTEEKKMYYFDLFSYMCSNEMAQEELCSFEAMKHLMQYTGLKDNNDKELYFNDLIQVYFGKAKWTKYVPIRDVFELSTLIQLINESGASFEIIGNIYENKRLFGNIYEIYILN